MSEKIELTSIPKRSGKPAAAKAAPRTAQMTQAALLEKLSTSCLDSKDAALLKMKPADAAELKSLGLPQAAAFEIPYFNAQGKLTKFKRWRYLEDTRTGFLAQTDAKATRYVQPPNTLPELYLPPLVDWQEIQSNPERAIVITEGELKAACCTKYADPCIGLGGVYSFKSKKKNLPLLPAFYEFNWEGREVIIAFDSDAHTNPMVVMARNALSSMLLSLGASVFIANMVDGLDGKKRGLDDLAEQEGPEALAELLGWAEPFNESKELHELSTEVTYIKDPGMVVVLDSGLKMRASDFTNHAYANRHYWVNVMDGKGNERSVKKSAATAWLQWPYRMELERVVYAPGDERLTEGREYNTWPGWGCEPKKGDITPWKRLLDHLFEGYPKERDWFERWCALPLQQPGKKMYSACAIWGTRTGTGKSLLGYTLGRIYGKNFTEIGDIELKDERNEWAIDKQFVMGDDVTGHEQRQYAERLKKMITQQTMRIDKKYVPSYTVRDCINYLFTSNHPDMFFLEDDDRRNFVFEVHNGPLEREFYREYMAWLDNTGPSALFFHLLNLPLKGLSAEDRAPDTNARSVMIDDGLSDIGRWVRGLRDSPEDTLKIGGISLKGDLWSSQDLHKLYDPDGKRRVTVGGMAKELKRAGFIQAYKGLPVRASGKQMRLFVVRNAAKWRGGKLQEIINHYEDTRCFNPKDSAIKKIKKF